MQLTISVEHQFMQKLRPYLFVLSIYVGVWKMRLDKYIFELLNPNAPVDLHDFLKVVAAIENAFSSRQYKVHVTQVITEEFQTTYPLKISKGMTQDDINATLPLIVAALRVEQWQVRPVEMSKPSLRYCIAVMY